MKTIDVNAKEWYDKINGNTYFAGEVIVDYGTEEQARYLMPFQYGYGDQYKDIALDTLKKALRGVSGRSLWRFCKDNNIILRTYKTKGLKRELKDMI
jgi:hypothetical protein